jgi:hypothetical protein
MTKSSQRVQRLNVYHGPTYGQARDPENPADQKTLGSAGSGSNPTALPKTVFNANGELLSRRAGENAELASVSYASRQCKSA